MAFLTPQQVSELARAVSPDWDALILTAAYTGLRGGELAGLRSARLDTHRRTITVVEARRRALDLALYG